MKCRQVDVVISPGAALPVATAALGLLSARLGTPGEPSEIERAVWAALAAAWLGRGVFCVAVVHIGSIVRARGVARWRAAWVEWVIFPVVAALLALSGRL